MLNCNILIIHQITLHVDKIDERNHRFSFLSRSFVLHFVPLSLQFFIEFNESVKKDLEF